MLLMCLSKFSKYFLDIHTLYIYIYVYNIYSMYIHIYIYMYIIGSIYMNLVVLLSNWAWVGWEHVPNPPGSVNASPTVENQP